MDALYRLHQPGLGAFGGIWSQVSELNRAGKPIREGLDDHDRIQPQECQIGQIILAQSLSSKVGMDQAKPSKTAGARACARQVRNKELVGIPDDDMGEFPSSIDEQAELPTELSRELTQPSGKLGSDKAVGWISAPVQSQECLGLALLQALGVAMKSLDIGPRSGGEGQGIRHRRRLLYLATNGDSALILWDASPHALIDLTESLHVDGDIPSGMDYREDSSFASAVVEVPAEYRDIGRHGHVVEAGLPAVGLPSGACGCDGQVELLL